MGNFIVFTLILFALAALLRIDFFFTIFYLFVGVYIVSRLWSRRALKKLIVSRTVPARAFLGERVLVTLKLENTGHLPILWLSINETFSVILSSPPFFQKVITLGGKSTHIAHYPLFARRRGYYQIGPLRLETGDLLGINHNLSGTIDADHLIVYPKIYPMTRLSLPTHSPQVVLPTPIPLFKDPARMIGVRAYTPGDNPRHIHWPATAAHGQMLVKQFQTAIARENAIFLNMTQTDYGRPAQANIAIELAIVTAASLANHMVLTEGLPVGLTTHATDPLTTSQQNFKLNPDTGRGHLMQILEVLARIELVETHDFLGHLRQEAPHLSWGTTMIIITGSASEALLETLLLLKRSGFKVALVLVQPAAYAYPDTPHLRNIGLTTFKIRREEDVEAWLPDL